MLLIILKSSFRSYIYQYMIFLFLSFDSINSLTFSVFTTFQCLPFIFLIASHSTKSWAISRFLCLYCWILHFTYRIVDSFYLHCSCLIFSYPQFWYHSGSSPFFWVSILSGFWQPSLDCEKKFVITTCSYWVRIHVPLSWPFYIQLLPPQTMMLRYLNVSSLGRF